MRQRPLDMPARGRIQRNKCSTIHSIQRSRRGFLLGYELRQLFSSKPQCYRDFQCLSRSRNGRAVAQGTKSRARRSPLERIAPAWSRMVLPIRVAQERPGLAER